MPSRRSRRRTRSKKSRRISRGGRRSVYSRRRYSRGGSATPKPKPRPSFKVGQAVKWTWMGNVAYGVITHIHTDEATVTVHGKTIKMKGSPTRPIYQLTQEDGTHLLKSALQLQKTTKKVKVPK